MRHRAPVVPTVVAAVLHLGASGAATVTAWLVAAVVDGVRYGAEQLYFDYLTLGIVAFVFGWALFAALGFAATAKLTGHDGQVTDRGSPQAGGSTFRAYRILAFGAASISFSVGMAAISLVLILPGATFGVLSLPLSRAAATAPRTTAALMTTAALSAATALALYLLWLDEVTAGETITALVHVLHMTVVSAMTLGALRGKPQ